MAGVGFDDHGVAGREGGSGVAARDREGEREVRGGEHRDRADADEHAAQLRTGRCQRRVGVVDRQFEVRALLDDGGEQPQLSGGSPDLASQAGLAEPGLLIGDRHELVGVRVEGVGRGTQPGCTVGRRGLAPHRRCRGRCRRHLCELLRSGAHCVSLLLC
jgi:hypothetical protein